jgi:hypothetical protein
MGSRQRLNITKRVDESVEEDVSDPVSITGISKVEDQVRAFLILKT